MVKKILFGALGFTFLSFVGVEKIQAGVIVKLYLMEISPVIICATTSQDSVKTDSIEADDEPEQRWTARAKISGTNRRTRYGVDVSRDLPSVTPKLGLDYDANDEWNVSTELGGAFIIGEGFQGWWWNFGVSWMPLEWLSIGASYTRDVYPTDPGNLLGDLTNTLSVSLDGSWDWFGASLAATHLPSDDQAATYLSAGISGDFSFGNFSISPSADITFVMQRIQNARIAQFAESISRPLPAIFQNRLYTSISEISAVSFDAAMSYKIAKGLKISLTPSFLVTPRTDLYSLREQQLILKLGLSYSLPF